MKLLKLTVLIFCVCLTVACGDEDGKSGGNNENNANNSQCGDSNRNGNTLCGVSTQGACQAGQYCNEEELTCSVGCTSDNNCAGNQFCDLSAGSPGTCRNCSEFSSNNDNNENNANNANNTGGNCDDAIDEGVRCQVIPSAQAAAAKTACNMGDATEVSSLNSCVNAAGGDCDQVTTCFGGTGGCSVDADCDQTAGQSHQVCSGGACAFGCRADEDCGQDYECDLDLGFGDAGLCVPAF